MLKIKYQKCSEVLPAPLLTFILKIISGSSFPKAHQIILCWKGHTITE